jgi:hypothetical protein
MALAVWDVGNAAVQSGATRSPAPLVAEGVRQAGAWAGSYGGAVLGAKLGIAVGAPSGPGAALLGLGLGLCGGALGYLSADAVADKIHAN